MQTVLGMVRAEDCPTHFAIFEAVSTWVDVSCSHTDAGDAENMAMWRIHVVATSGDAVLSYD